MEKRMETALSGDVTGDVNREALALSSPTRVRMMRYILDAADPVSVSELTDLLGLNHNAIRQHLAVLRDAGMLEEFVEERSRPGRPRLLYRGDVSAAGRLGSSSSYSWLAKLLSVALRRGLEPRQVGRQEGHRLAAGLQSTPDPLEPFEAELTRRGFQPRRQKRGSHVEFVLERCPFAEVAANDPVTICQMHRGLAEGLAEGLGGLRVDGLVSKDPYRAGCRLKVGANGTDE